MAWSQDRVYRLVRKNGGSHREAQFLASVVPGESGGRLNIENSIGAFGLFQIYDGKPGAAARLRGRPNRQAKEALAKLRSQGKGAWAASRGSWQPYRGKGGKSFNASRGGGGRLPDTLSGHLRTIPGVDRSAERQQLRLSYLGKSKMPSQASLLNLAGQLRNVQDSPSSQAYDIKRVPGGRVGGGGGGGATTGRTKVTLAPGADRPGVKTSHYLRRVLSGVRGIPGGITITTGSNHNRMTVDGNVSDHWTGHAADIAVPVDSRRGDLIAGRALMRLGVPRARARQMARQGGLFNVNYHGHRWQVIWKTNQGGNHHNHVHVGVR
jgi:hypothetical protein